MKIVFIYFIFCCILLYIYWHYARLSHLEKCKQTKMMERHYDAGLVAYATAEPERVAVNVIPVNKNSKLARRDASNKRKYKTKKKK